MIVVLRDRKTFETFVIKNAIIEDYKKLRKKYKDLIIDKYNTLEDMHNKELTKSVVVIEKKNNKEKYFRTLGEAIDSIQEVCAFRVIKNSTDVTYLKNVHGHLITSDEKDIYKYLVYGDNYNREKLTFLDTARDFKKLKTA